jgi:site-specific DNA-methyltransferase (adenine-specific)
MNLINKNMNNDLMFSSKTPEYETPQYLFDELDRQFHFKLDVCATEKNAKCNTYISEEVDGLTQEWWKSAWNWCNPPYGRNIGKWVEKCTHYKTVCLLPARTDTRWFHDFIYNKQNVEIRFIKGRLKFGDSKNSAPFPSMICVFNKFV